MRKNRFNARALGLFLLAFLLVVLPAKAQSGGYYTFYAHLSRASVSVGQKVRAGDKIGEVGCTGYCTAGPHLHFGKSLLGPEVDRDWDTTSGTHFVDPNLEVNPGWIPPVEPYRILSGSAKFGEYNPGGHQAQHNAIDLQATGGQDVYAVADGVVVWTSWWPSWTESAGTGHGITVWIYHDGTSVSWFQTRTGKATTNWSIAGAAVLLIVTLLLVFKKKNPQGFYRMKRVGKNALAKIGRAAWATYLILEQLIVGEPGSYKRMRNKIFLGAIFTVVSVVGCIFVIALLSVLNDHSVSPQKIAEKVADASPHLDNYLQFLNGEMPIMRSWTAPMTRSDNVLYTGVYGAIKGWGTLGETSNAVEAVIAAVKYANEVKSWYSGQVVPVVNVRINSDEIMTGIIELCRGKCIVMIDVTPNQDVLGIIRKWAPQGNHVWIDVDLEHRVIPTSAQEFNSWASEYFTIRQQSGFNSLGVFAFYDFRADPWLTPPQDVVWTYNNGEGIVVPIFDGHCAGTSCWEAKITSTSDVLSNYPGAQAIGIMEFLRRWGCGSQYGDCGFTAQQYWQKFQPLILMSQ